MQLGRASKSLGSGENAVRSEINVTPLVDVCLVLLIIFMVVTPLLVDGRPLVLPETDNPSPMPEGAKNLELAIEPNGNVYVEDDWLPGEPQIAARLLDIYNSTPDKEVVIKADRRLKYRDVRNLMRIVNEAGFAGVGLAAKKKEAADGG
jgi:biopolymer transport protein TolR